MKPKLIIQNSSFRLSGSLFADVSMCFDESKSLKQNCRESRKPPHLVVAAMHSRVSRDATARDSGVPDVCDHDKQPPLIVVMHTCLIEEAHHRLPETGTPIDGLVLPFPDSKHLL